MSAPTPKCDAQTCECRQYYDQGGFSAAARSPDKSGECIDADFARSLERQRDSALSALRISEHRISVFFSRFADELDTELYNKVLEEIEMIEAILNPPQTEPR